MLDRLASNRRRWVLGILFVLVLWFCWTVRSVLNPILLGYLLAYVLHPLVVRLEKRGFRRRTAVGVIFALFALFILIVGVAVFLQAQSLWTDMSVEGGVVDQIDVRLRQGVEQTYRFLEKWGIVQPSLEPGGTRPRLRDMLGQLRQLSSDEIDVGAAGKAGIQAAGGALVFVRAFFGSLFSLATLLFLLPIYTYFLLFELERIHRFVITYVPARDREKVISIGTQIGIVLSSFLRGRLVVSLLKGAFIALGLWIIGVPYALLLGLIAAFLSLIPVVGPLIAFVLGFLFAMLHRELFDALWRAGIVYLLAEFLEGYVLMPKVLGESLGLHPVVVLASLMIGGAALGMFGLLLALPIAATIIILAREIVLPALAKTTSERRS
ncbi:MAG TPA: AI-2E family transporter [Planctomycetota bacterium]|nr:AI-2E family transporter [Planctomycetota bacterium]